MRATTIAVSFCLGVLAVAGGCTQQDASKQASTQPTGQKWVYTITEDDTTFAAIAKSVFGDSRYGPDIANANPDVAESDLIVGKQIVIPAIAGLTPQRQSRTRINIYTD